jgi:hypothetical protein
MPGTVCPPKSDTGALQVNSPRGEAGTGLIEEMAAVSPACEEPKASLCPPEPAGGVSSVDNPSCTAWLCRPLPGWARAHTCTHTHSWATILVGDNGLRMARSSHLVNTVPTEPSSSPGPGGGGSRRHSWDTGSFVIYEAFVISRIHNRCLKVCQARLWNIHELHLWGFRRPPGPQMCPLSHTYTHTHQITVIPPQSSSVRPGLASRREVPGHSWHPEGLLARVGMAARQEMGPTPRQGNPHLRMIGFSPQL